jgi:PAS domain S-box-containing protein
MESQYQHYFDNLPCYLSVQDKDLNIIDSNRLLRKHFGDPAGRKCYQMYKQRSEKCEDCTVDMTFRDGKGHRREGQVLTADGREVAVIVFTTPILDDSGEVVSVMKMSADITEIKLLQEQLRESQQRYQLLFDESPCFISIQDPDLKIVEANRRFKEAFGTHLGYHCYKIYKHRSEECVPCSVQETFQDGLLHHSEEVVTSQDGGKISTLVYSAPIRDSGGSITHVMEMSTDITPIRRLQTQLESIGILISTISHGIKGMLTGLDGGVYMVNTGLKKNNPKRLEKGWEMVQRNVDRIRNMVLNILYYAKERVPNWEDVKADDVVNDVLSIAAPRAEEHSVTLTRGSTSGAGVFEADAKAIHSLLINLVENSIDACRVDEKKDHHEVTIAAAGTDEQVEFVIQDDGIGMDRETREKAFTLFFSSKGVEGTGLGLFIANNIAQAHGGTIELTSEVDGGTSFRVIIPRKRPV